VAFLHGDQLQAEARTDVEASGGVNYDLLIAGGLSLLLNLSTESACLLLLRAHFLQLPCHLQRRRTPPLQKLMASRFPAPFFPAARLTVHPSGHVTPFWPRPRRGVCHSQPHLRCHNFERCLAPGACLWSIWGRHEQRCWETFATYSIRLVTALRS
jgi:hypothetical protein